jgi:hypothetical protein
MYVFLVTTTTAAAITPFPQHHHTATLILFNPALTCKIAYHPTM